MSKKSTTIKVALREKVMKDGRKSLYLDFYPAIKDLTTGKDTRREFLGLYIYTPIKTTAKKVIYHNDKVINEIWEQHNINTLQVAETIKHKRQNEFDKPEIYSDFEKERMKEKEISGRLFTPYFKSLVDKREGSNEENWKAAYLHFLKFSQNATFADITENFCENFKDFLLNVSISTTYKQNITQNTASIYFTKFKAVLNQAYKEDLLKTNISAKVKNIKMKETEKGRLTIDELNALIKTECKFEDLKNAALFSALTGVRYVDIKKMTWKEIVFVEGKGWYMDYTAQKTQKKDFKSISNDAYNLLGTRKSDDMRVFDTLKENTAYQNEFLKLWILKAGIDKNITFHCFRHTFATLQLESGTDIYTVSKMLGHSDLKTTQIYAKVLDPTKRAAADKIKLNFQT